MSKTALQIAVDKLIALPTTASDARRRHLMKKIVLEYGEHIVECSLQSSSSLIADLLACNDLQQAEQRIRWFRESAQ